MHPAPSITAQPLTAVEISGLVGERAYLDTLPSARHVSEGRDGKLVVWLEARIEDTPSLDEARPERPPEVELHGEGPPCAALVEHPRAQHVEMFFDGLGDPVAAPRGWWHARIWLRAA